MAIIQPKILYAATPGESYLHEFFYKNLPDDVYVYYEKNIDTLLPDFIIVDPSSGVMIIEVKDWDVHFWTNTIVATKEKITVHGKATRNPKDQGLMYQKQLYALLRNTFSKQSKNKSTTRTSFPVNHLVAFPNLTRIEFDSLFADQEQMKSILDPQYIIFKDDFDNIETSTTPQDDLQSLISEKRFHKFGKGQYRITDSDMKCITAAIDPKVIIGGSPDGLFRSMEQIQITESSFIPNSNRIIRGIAGSGKSLMLLHQIDYICKHHKDKKILLVNYTISLRASYFERYNSDEYKNVSVLGQSEACKPNDDLYDYIFIDESQDFTQKQLKDIIARKKADQDSFVTMCTDWGQHLYNDDKNGYAPFNYTFSDLGIPITPKDIVDLTINYRNTRQIAVLAHNFLHDKSVSMNTHENKMNNMFLTEMKTALRDGRSDPVLLECDNTQIAVDNIVKRVFELTNQGIDHNEIAILVHTKNGNAEKSVDILMKNLKSHKIDVFSLLNDNNKGKSQPPNHILINTIHSSKGFEYKHVLLYANLNLVELYEVNKRALYVGLTRAQETLTVIVDNQNSAITKLLKKAFKDTKEMLENDSKKYLDTSSVNEAHLKYQQAFHRIRNIILMIKSDNVLEHLQPIFDICKNMGFDIDGFGEVDNTKLNANSSSVVDVDMKSLEEYNALLAEKDKFEKKYATLLMTTESNKRAHRKEIDKHNAEIQNLIDNLKTANENIEVFKSKFNRSQTECKNLKTQFTTTEMLFSKSEKALKNSEYELTTNKQEFEEYVDKIDKANKKRRQRKAVFIVAAFMLTAIYFVIPAITSLFNSVEAESSESNVEYIDEPYSILGSIYYVPAKFAKIRGDIEFPTSLDNINEQLSKFDKARTAQGSYTTIKVITDPTNSNGKLKYETIVAETFFEGTTLEFSKDNDTGVVSVHAYKYDEDQVEDIKKISVDVNAVGIQFAFSNDFAIYNVDVADQDLFKTSKTDEVIKIWLNKDYEVAE